MKTIKRSIALVLAMILTLAMSVTVFAAPNADQNTFSLTLNKAVKGHTYEAYQILSGDLSADKATLSNIKWGEGITEAGQTALGGDAASYAEKLGGFGNNSSELKEQAQIIGANLASASGSVTVTDPDAKNVISNLKPGYYLIKDQDNSLQGQESYTEFILHITDDVVANVKADVPSVEKKVKDTNGCYVVPAFTGLGAPHWDQYARGTIVGITRGVNKYHIIRATLESLAYQTNDVLQAMQADSGIHLGALKVDGGASANNFLMQFQADIENAEIVRPVITETTALGVAYLAGLAVGYYDSLDEIKGYWKADRRFEPGITEDKRETLLAGWKDAGERTRVTR